MTPREFMLGRLKELCDTHGADHVGERTGLSADNLRNLIAGAKLKSGNLRGIGPSIQRALDAHFPGWADIPNENNANKLSSVNDALNIIERALDAIDISMRDAVALNMSEWAKSGGSPSWKSALSALLAPSKSTASGIENADRKAA